VTLVVANPEHRYPLACREDPERLGLRLVDGPLAGMMWPVFQTSANHSGEPAPAIFADVPRSILSAVDVAIDGGALAGSPSTVVDVTRIDSGGDWTILRQGGMSAEELRERFTSV
jgi:L-threonylcarbamoyladenylate synthase